MVAMYDGAGRALWKRHSERRTMTTPRVWRPMATATSKSPGRPMARLGTSSRRGELCVRSEVFHAAMIVSPSYVNSTERQGDQITATFLFGVSAVVPTHQAPRSPTIGFKKYSNPRSPHRGSRRMFAEGSTLISSPRKLAVVGLAADVDARETADVTTAVRPKFTIRRQKQMCTDCRQGVIAPACTTTALYDLQSDIGEKYDVAGDNPGIVAALEMALAAWKAEVSFTKFNEWLGGTDRIEPVHL